MIDTDAIIKKAKFREGYLHITLEEKLGDTEKTIAMRSAETPHEDLRLAFEALEPVAREILMLPSEWRKGEFRIVGVSWSFSESTGVKGAVITGAVTLDTSDAPFNFNTPHLPFEPYSPTGNSPLMPDEGREALDHLEAEVKAFIDGKRAQQNFDFGAAA
jgi:hypothetical protein